MSSFGETLRKYRESSKDVKSSRHLSQEHLAELVGRELGLRNGLSGAAVSDWERGESEISASDRLTLVAIVKVLYKQGGLKNIPEADLLLEAGNYKGLSLDEKNQVFPEKMIDGDEQEGHPLFEKSRKLILFWSGNIFYDNENLTEQLARAEEGPPPSWPRKVVVLINGGMAGSSVFRTLRLFLWFLLLLFSMWLIAPSLRWPFTGQAQAASVIIMYIAGSLSVPAIVGLFTNTRNNPFWRERQLATDRNLRLYTHQGSVVGFHVGYFGIFAINLALYYFGSRSTQWLELVEITLLLVVTYWSAHLVPYNLLKAYQRLDLADGAIFFVFMILGPVWGAFFYYDYPILLDTIAGPWVVLSACGLLIFGVAWQYRRTGSTIIPAHWWVFLGGFVLVVYQMTVAKNTFSVVALAGIIIALGTLLALERIRFTLRGLLGFLFVAFILQVIFSFNLWVGRTVTGIALFLWWRWGKEYLSFPLVFWGVVVALAVCLWGWKQQWLPDNGISVVFAVVTTLLLLWEYKFARLAHHPA